MTVELTVAMLSTDRYGPGISVGCRFSAQIIEFNTFGPGNLLQCPFHGCPYLCRSGVQVGMQRGIIRTAILALGAIGFERAQSLNDIYQMVRAFTNNGV
jgi:hypothetical protein